MSNMPLKDPRIDAYIEKAQPFAKPILKKIRTLIHKACPDVKETIKWGMPAFDFHGPYCSMAAFKQHCAFGFWKSTLIKDPGGYLQPHSAQGGDAMGNLGRITSKEDLPPDSVMTDLLIQAKKINEQGLKVVKQKAGPKPPPLVPDDLGKALAKNKKAKSSFEQFSDSMKREYILWITEAKTESTRFKRIATTVEWVAEGKSRNWKYEKK